MLRRGRHAAYLKQEAKHAGDFAVVNSWDEDATKLSASRVRECGRNRKGGAFGRRTPHGLVSRSVGGGGGANVEFNLGLGFGALAVEVGRVVAPVSDGAGNRREHAEIAVEGFDVGDVAVFVDGGLNGEGAGRTGCLNDRRVDAVHDVAEGNVETTLPQPTLARDTFAGDTNQTANMDRSSRGADDVLAR